MEPKQINITLGTAGHIDHGKTALVRLLTGCETDRLKEEKERGMSIELGFAPCTIGDKEVGIVDVPGHEHFIKTMVAGATGIDAVLLVVAADDGVMPQTREHLDILTLLGIDHGIVALTKIDRADAARIEAVRRDIASVVRGTFLDAAAILPISNITGDGYDRFYAGLQALVASVKPKTAAGVFRLPVERAFSIQGYGTVVSGIPAAGAVRVGDEIVLLPADLAGRVSAVQAYGRDTDEAKAGQCAAINIRHWDARAVSRGDVVTVPGYFEPEQWFLCSLRLLANDNARTKNAARVKFHTGTSEVQATVYVLEGNEIAPGEGGFVQVRLDAPLVAGPGDRFLIRRISPPATIGGGRIIEADPRKIKRNRPQLAAELDLRAAAIESEVTFAEYALRTAQAGATTVRDVAHRIKVLEARAREILAVLVRDGKAVELGGGLFSLAQAAEQNEARILGILDEFHRTTPDTAGITFDAWQAASQMTRPVFEALVKRLAAAGRVREAKGLYAAEGHTVALSEADRKLVDTTERLLAEKPYAPPAPEEIATMMHVSAAEASRALRILKESGRAVEIAPGMFMTKEAVDRAHAAVVAFIEKDTKLESVKFKYIIDTTRKYAIPLLDYFDKIGVTLRVGNTRYLKGK